MFQEVLSLMKYILFLLLLALPLPASALTILALGDSLTSGFGLQDNEGFVPQLQQTLRDEGINATIINGGVAGDTSAAGLARLDWSLAEQADLVLLEFGANDALRGLDPAMARANLEQMIRRVQERGSKILLLGMRAPRNLGQDYVKAFDTIYPELAAKYHIPLYPFFLEGVAGDSALNQADGLHPNKEGVAKIIRNLLPYLKQAIG